MAKQSSIQKNLRRKLMVKKYQNKRLALKKKIKNKNLNLEERIKLQSKLNDQLAQKHDQELLDEYNKLNLKKYCWKNLIKN